MKFKIDFDIPKQNLKIEWPSFFTLGSCFAQNQAQRMAQLGLEVYSNPFGILYNPISIGKIVSRIVNQQLYTASDFENRKSIFSWEHHGNFKYNNFPLAIEESNSLLKEAQNALKTSNCILITLGTSLVYKHKSITVANCHRVSNNEFVQEQLSFDEIKHAISQIVKDIHTLNSKAKIILTVSPIRHLRSGIVESSRSKATLIAAIHEVNALNKETSYFPSYEIFIDELRDYRFAKEDLTHPTAQAEKYIWDRFASTYFSNSALKTLDDVKKYRDFEDHRPDDTDLYQKQLTEKKALLHKQYPFLKL
ncbi:MAG: hypothetical protein COA58_14450 [Bacteroidetes bacterium]|nr:MAG: hypothetical protein COA58_14450 [Bacteroidota bacterium]